MSKSNKDKPSIGETGISILKTAKRVAKEQVEESKKRRAGGNVTTFWVPRGEEKEMIVLDDSIEKGWGMWEHNIRGRDGKFGRRIPCLRDGGNCPLCNSGDRSYYGVFLTVLDLTPWTDNAGKEHSYTKRLLCIKSGQLDAICRIQEAAIEKHGTLRGCYIVMARGEGEKTAGIGEPAPQKGAKLFQMYDEDSLIAEFGHKALKDKETGAIFRTENESIQPYRYKKIFPVPDVEALEEEFGDGASDGPVAGSKRQSRKFAEDEDEDDAPKKKSSRSKYDDDEDEDDAPKKPKRHKFDEDDEPDEDEDEKPVKKKRRVVEDDDEDEDDAPKSKKRSSNDEPDEDEDEKPVKKKRRVVEDDDEDEDEEEEVKPRKRNRPVVDDDDEDEAPVKRKKKVVDADEEEDEDDEDEEPVAKKKKNVKRDPFE